MYFRAIGFTLVCTRHRLAPAKGKIKFKTRFKNKIIMKKRYLIGGYIEIEYQAFISLMKNMLTASKVRDRYAADVEKVIHYEDEKLYIYIYEDGHKGFLFDAELKGALEEAQDFINRFTEKLRNDNLVHQFEWYEVDENDNQIGEEFEVKFPENSSN